ncbi:Uncharacterized protein HA466_0149250 [Hirschfeldia incana]|nr:Uncharacterized protein HA466_0149250 [Hirschfeldia incana]
MKGVIPNYHHSYTFFFVILVLFPHAFSTNTLSSNEALTISSNKTLVSPGDVFELGFFKTTTRSSQDGSTDRWYLGIWYKTTSDHRTYVWIANRDNPLHNSIGTLKISHSSNLVLLDQSDTPVWSTNLTGVVKSPATAELLANGNFVLRGSYTIDLTHFMWQSFDFPVDTLLPEMKLGRNLIGPEHEKILTSWKSPTDPSSGDYSLILETEGFLHEFYLFKNEFKVYRTGPWNGVRFNGIPKKMQNWSYIVNNFIDNKEEVAYSFQVNNNHNIHSRFRMSSTGYLQVITWTKTVPQRNMFWSFPEDACDLYQVCGPYAYCDMHTTPMCNCIKGFVPKNAGRWDLRDMSGGCVRSSPLTCGEGDGFMVLGQMKMPETSEAFVEEMIGLEECSQKCVRDCNCTGFAIMDNMNGGSGCVMWTGELVDMRKYDAGGQTVYVKVAEASVVPSLA